MPSPAAFHPIVLIADEGARYRDITGPRLTMPFVGTMGGRCARCRSARGRTIALRKNEIVGAKRAKAKETKMRRAVYQSFRFPDTVVCISLYISRHSTPTFHSVSLILSSLSLLLSLSPFSVNVCRVLDACFSLPRVCKGSPTKGKSKEQRANDAKRMLNALCTV